MFKNRKDYIELLGVIGVIGSLIFVGMQLLLDRKVSIADQYQARAELRILVPLAQLESSEYINTQAGRWEKQRPSWWNEEVEEYWKQSGEPMTAIVLDVLDITTFGISMDNNAFQYNQGLMSEESWAVFRRVLRNAIEADPLRKAFITTRNGMPNLSPVVDQLLEEINSGQ